MVVYDTGVLLVAILEANRMKRDFLSVGLQVAGFIAAALAPTLLFILFTRPTKYPNPAPPPPDDASVPVSKESP